MFTAPSGYIPETKDLSLQNATIEYSCMPLFLCACFLCVGTQIIKDLGPYSETKYEKGRIRSQYRLSGRALDSWWGMIFVKKFSACFVSCLV